MYWYWAVSGLLLIMFEFVVPGLVICFFGFSALIVALMKYLFPTLALSWQLLIFAFGGLLMVLLFRQFVPRGVCKEMGDGRENIDDDDIAGAVAVCKEAIGKDKPGKVEFRGSFWNAVSDEDIAVGELCLIEKRNNLELTVSTLKK